MNKKYTRIFVYLTLITIFTILPAQAKHPKLKFIWEDNTKYTCRPVDSVSYCPSREAALMILIKLDRQNCLDKINPNEATRDAIEKCYLVASQKSYFETIQLLDFKKECLDEKLSECMEIDYSCSSPPCGDLGYFLQELGKRGLEKFFTEKDGQQACQKLIY